MSNQTSKKSGFAWAVLRGVIRAALTPVAVVVFGIAALYSMLILSVEWLRCFIRRDYTNVRV